LKIEPLLIQHSLLDLHISTAGFVVWNIGSCRW